MGANEGLALDALGEPTRRIILERLRHGALSVGAIADGLPVSRPAVSQHLRVLREARLVTENRQGTRRMYRLEPEGLSALRIYLEGFWWDALAALEQVAETAERSNG